MVFFIMVGCLDYMDRLSGSAGACCHEYLVEGLSALHREAIAGFDYAI